MNSSTKLNESWYSVTGFQKNVTQKLASVAMLITSSQFELYSSTKWLQKQNPKIID